MGRVWTDQRDDTEVVSYNKTPDREFLMNLAGREGFEPSVEIYSPDNRLAGGPIRPLWHLPSIQLSNRRKERDSNPR